MSGRYNNHHAAEAGESDGDGAGHHPQQHRGNAQQQPQPQPQRAPAAAAANATTAATATAPPPPQQQEPRRSSTASYAHHAHSHHKGANERLYEAYSELHCLAQDFEKPFDAPAILVVGHQTDGKSALVEALMGFQFNHVGGGTKTRRPITLHMKYNSTAVQPACFLQVDDLSASGVGGAGFGAAAGFGGVGASAAATLTDGLPMQEVTLEELQEYIEAENQRLEAEGQFWAKEIVVRIEYKYCPNLTIIDTPGLISAAPGRKNTGLQSAARQVEAMVRQKMAQREYIILCLEDTSDWNNATTRRVVMSVDPTLSRTVVVSTKLDTRIPQFATPLDVETFLRAPGLQLDTNMLGGAPFFTSVPSGRVGVHRDAVFRSNEHFREAVAERALQDVSELEGKLGRK
jgi:GTPase SAR1 family protein